MSERRKLREYMEQLTEIRDIMDAMKSLAMLETVKLGKQIETQHALLKNLERVAGDFLEFYPYPGEPDGDAGCCWIIFGSERGFCGDFNEALLDYFKQQLAAAGDSEVILIPVGNKLSNRLQNDPRVVMPVEGADVVEEINAVLGTVIGLINEQQTRHGMLDILVIFHDYTTEKVSHSRLTPPFGRLTGKGPRAGYPPLLNISPERFFSDFLERFLFVTLQEIACSSLIAENYYRIRHMTGAVQWLDEKNTGLLRRYNIRRQEEITEELEVILLNSP